MKFKFNAILAFFLSAYLGSASAESCRVFLAENGVATEALSFTDQTIAYLEKLVEINVITDESLNRFAQKFENPVPHKVINSSVQVRSEDKPHYDAFEEILKNSQLDRKKISDWVANILKKSAIIQKEKKESSDKAKNLTIPMVFNRVEPGSFTMGRQIIPTNPTAHVTLTNAFEMMATPVTQSMWLELMKELPPHHNGKIRKNHPITGITWWSALVFANKLSRKHGLKPVYDLRTISFEPGTNAENGGLKSERPKNVKINAPNGDIYQAEGYRLPTAAEQEFVRSNRGEGNGDDFPGLDHSMRDRFIHLEYPSSSNQHLQMFMYFGHEVASLLPFIIGGKTFYDLWGNISEWGYDWHQTRLIFDSNINPVIDKLNESYGNNERTHQGDPSKVVQWSSNHGGLRPNISSHILGFRLVRTVK